MLFLKDFPLVTADKYTSPGIPLSYPSRVKGYHLSFGDKFVSKEPRSIESPGGSCGNRDLEGKRIYGWHCSKIIEDVCLPFAGGNVDACLLQMDFPSGSTLLSSDHKWLLETLPRLLEADEDFRNRQVLVVQTVESINENSMAGFLMNRLVGVLLRKGMFCNLQKKQFVLFNQQWVVENLPLDVSSQVALFLGSDWYTVRNCSGQARSMEFNCPPENKLTFEGYEKRHHNSGGCFVIKRLGEEPVFIHDEFFELEKDQELERLHLISEHSHQISFDSFFADGDDLKRIGDIVQADPESWGKSIIRVLDIFDSHIENLEQNLTRCLPLLINIDTVTMGPHCDHQRVIDIAEKVLPNVKQFIIQTMENAAPVTVKSNYPVVIVCDGKARIQDHTEDFEIPLHVSGYGLMFDFFMRLLQKSESHP